MTQVRFDKDKTLERMTNNHARLWAWKEDIEALIANYGEDAIMFTDSGKNDTQFVIETGDE
jgi:hypothetical protein